MISIISFFFFGLGTFEEVVAVFSPLLGEGPTKIEVIIIIIIICSYIEINDCFDLIQEYYLLASLTLNSFHSYAFFCLSFSEEANPFSSILKLELNSGFFAYVSSIYAKCYTLTQFLCRTFGFLLMFIF
jgi:hypothetical protein